MYLLNTNREERERKEKKKKRVSDHLLFRYNASNVRL